MAKGQKRSTREIRKPKAAKPASGVPSGMSSDKVISLALVRGSPTPIKDVRKIK